MSDLRNLIVGLDLSKEYTQICCYNYKTLEAESLSMAKDKYLIPTALGVKNYSKDWVFGEEAVTCHEKNTGVFVDRLLERVEDAMETEIFGTSFSPVTLLEKFLRKCLQVIKTYYPGNSILRIVVTLKELQEDLIKGVYQALKNLGIDKDRALVQSYAQSYQYYALSQSKELWTGDIGLFDFDAEGLIYQQITVNRSENPYVVSLIEKSFKDTLSFDMLEKYAMGENLEYIFQNIAMNVLHKQVVSTLYATGIGFESSWADNVLKDLCIGRRVFKGQNLYAKGACYAARELTDEKSLGDFVFLGKEMITGNLTTEGYLKAGQAEIVLVRAFQPWYEVDTKVDFILEELNEIPIYITNSLTKERKKYTIDLNGLTKRPDRTTRIELRVKFYSQSTAVITVKDKGFGSFYPSSNRIWEETVEIK
ncbi:MAG: hypothetical protein K0R92_2569 [Lachnospiraceae bacterium]|jgi:hypothetical protein|nr:hypothetical protein [Lachnospiraceae bacterium]